MNVPLPFGVPVAIDGAAGTMTWHDPIFDAENVVGRSFDPSRDGIAVRGAPAHGLEYQEIESPPENVDAGLGHAPIGFLCKSILPNLT